MLRKCFDGRSGRPAVLSARRGHRKGWIPLFLKKLNESQMQSLGMRITA